MDVLQQLVDHHVDSLTAIITSAATLDDDVLDGDLLARQWAADWGRVVDALTESGDLLADPVMRAVVSALALLLIVVLARRWVWQPLFSPRGAYVVYGVRHEGPEVATLALTPVFRRRGLPASAPGQFVWLRRHRRVVGVQEHPFTIASSAELTDRLELTVRATGDFTRALARMGPGTKVWLDGPHGAFVPRTAGADGGLVLIAGGVGVTPIMSILRAHAAAADPRAHALLLAEREGEALFAAEILALSRRLDLSVLRTGGRRLDAGMLRALVPPGDAPSHQYFVCGPPPLVGAAIHGLGSLGVPAGAITTERFG